MVHATFPIRDKVRAAIQADERDKTPGEFLGKIQVAYICNDENNPIGVHPHGPMAFARGGTVNVTDNKGGFTSTTQTRVQQALNSQGTAANDLTVNIYTVTSGKTLYVTSLSVGSDNQTADTINYIDVFDATSGSSSDTLRRWTWRGINGPQSREITFPVVPLVFTTGIRVRVLLTGANTGSIDCSFVGWEE